ncbi:peroxiredoxin, type II, partial [Haematococcus lacustris]
MLVGWNPASVPNLYGKVAVITGANSGIGYETTRKLAENGAEVYMVVRNMDKGQAAVEQLRKELGPVKLHLLQADMESMSQVQSLLAELRGVRPDILLHNAGILYPGPFRLTEEGLEPTLAISYYSGVLLALGLLDQMKPRSRVIFMGKKVMVVGFPGGKVCTEKHIPGYVQMTDMFERKGVDKVLCVTPMDPAAVQELASRPGLTSPKVELVSDKGGAFVRLLGLELGSQAEGGPQCQRYAGIVEDGILLKVKVERSPAELQHTDAKSMCELWEAVYGHVPSQQ